MMLQAVCDKLGIAPEMPELREYFKVWHQISYELISGQTLNVKYASLDVRYE